LDSFLAGGVVVCSVGSLELVDSGLRESRESGSPPPRERRHGHGLLMRDVLPGPPSRADDELGFREGVQALRRAVSSLSRLPDGGNPADLCQARGLADARSLLPASEWARSQENERPPWNAPRRSRATQRRERTVWTVISEATCQPTILHLVASRRETSTISSVVSTDVRSETLPACGSKDPLNEVGSDVGTTASLSSALGDTRHPQIPDIAMSRATWSRPTSERLAVRRRHERLDPIPEKFAYGRATRMGIRTASPLPEPTVAGSLPPHRCAGHLSVRQMGSAELPVYLEGGRGTLRAVSAAAKNAEA